MNQAEINELISKLSIVGKLKAALMCELLITYQLGEQKAPRDRAKEFIVKVIDYYSTQFAMAAIHGLMEASIKTDAAIELIMLSHERYYSEKASGIFNSLVNMREGLIKDFPTNKEGNDARPPHQD
jgi:hypothetical protein